MDAQPAPHPTDRTLRAFGLGRLDDASAESVNRHLEGCPDCRRRVAAMSADSFLDRLRNAGARPEPLQSAFSSTDGPSPLDPGAAPAPPPADTLPPGLADHPDYEVIRELGQGGMGTVFLARNTLMNRLEVLKVVSGHLLNHRGILDRFLGEIRNAAKLHHTNIVAAYSAVRLGDGLALAMEYVEGMDLSRLVKARGPLPVANACHYIHQAALGLQHAHEHGMVHRDIKPSNLMLTRQGSKAVVKVLDFGLAKVQSEGPVDGGLTHEGQMLGTPAYIAPEQISDARHADIRADIYSLGCTLYYLLAGQPPFRGNSLYDILQAHYSTDAMPLNLVRPEVPTELAALVAKMMAKEPGRRFQAPREVAQVLKPFFQAGNTASVGGKPEVSQASRTVVDRGASRAGAASTQPMTNPAAAPRKPAGQAPAEPAWDGLIDLRDSDPLHDPSLDSPGPKPAPTPRSPREWTTIADMGRRVPGGWWAIAGVFLLGVAIAWAAGVLKVRTKDGVIVLENLPEQAEVYVDGDKVTVSWPEGGVPAEITVPSGKHGVQVKAAGFTAFGEEVTVQAGGRKGIRIRLEPDVASHPRERSVRDQPSTPLPPAPIAADRFAEFAGKWAVDRGELVQSDPTKWNAALLFGDERWTDYDLTVEALRTGGKNSFSLFFRNTSRGDGYEYEVAGAGNWLCAADAREAGRSRLLEKGFRYSLDSFKWYTARVHVRGTHCVCSLYDNGSGKDVGRLEFVDDRHPRGRVGLGTWLSTFRFKNIKVTSPDGTVLWEGPPAIESSGPDDAARATGDAPKVSGAANRPDLLVAGSVWRGEPGGSLFQVLERQVGRFKARLLVGQQVREVNGTVKDGRIRWLARDVRVIAGKPGGDNEGTMAGNEISMTWSDPGGPIRGRFTLRLQGTRPTDAKVFQGKFYRLFPEKMSWHDARSRCQELGGHLAVVTNDEQNRFLTSLARERGIEMAWLGATDERVEGRWVWVDGTPMRYNSWDVELKQPNNKQGLEHYLVLLVSRRGLWSDQPNQPDQHSPGFICQWD
jgi:serine/threonine protein kinase